MKAVKDATLPLLRFFGLTCTVYPLLVSAALPTVPGASTTIYASVPDPVSIDIGNDGVLFVGRDLSG